MNASDHRLSTIRREIESAKIPSLLPYQNRWNADDSAIKLAEKSRRTGFTFGTAYGFLESRLSGRRPYDMWFSSADESAAEEMGLYVSELGRAINTVSGEVSGLTVLDEDDMRKFQVRVPIGDTGRFARFTAMSSNPRRFRSKGGDVTLDEFAFHADPEAMLKAAVPCIQWGGQLSIISTHNGEHSLFNQLVMMGKRRREPEVYGAPKPTDREISLHTVTLLDAVDEGLVELISRVRGVELTREKFIADAKARAGADFDEEFMCVPSGEESSYFPASLTRACVSDKCPKIIERVGDGVKTDPAVWRRDISKLIATLAVCSADCSALFAGVDIGRSVDRFVIWAVAKFGDTYRTVGSLVWQDMPFEAMEAACDAVMNWRSPGGTKVRRMVIDATGIGAQIGESMERKHRNRVEAVAITNTLKADFMPLLRTHLEQRTITLPDDIATLADLASVSKTVTASGAIRYAGARTKDGHADRATGIALALHAADQAPAAVATGYMFAKGGGW
jgi:phage FluMu gp28-like protein